MINYFLNADNAAINQTSHVFNMDAVPGRIGNIGVQVIGASLNAADSTVTLQQSNDGTNFDDVLNADGTVFTITMASGSTNQCEILTNQAFMYLRATYTNGTNSAGTITVLINFK